jgi:hypothetical protein
VNQSKYYIRVMRLIFQRAILTVEASTDKAAMQAALDKAAQLTDSEWALVEAESDQPIVEIALSEDETEGSDADRLAFLSDVRHAYALLQADLEEGEGLFIAPTWLRHQPALTIADVTQDWSEALSGIYEEGVEEFSAWLRRQTHPTNIVNFFAERDKRRGKPDDDPKESGPNRGS